jgi:hypothetical protein
MLRSAPRSKIMARSMMPIDAVTGGMLCLAVSSSAQVRSRYQLRLDASK